MIYSKVVGSALWGWARRLEHSGSSWVVLFFVGHSTQSLSLRHLSSHHFEGPDSEEGKLFFWEMETLKRAETQTHQAVERQEGIYMYLSLKSLPKASGLLVRGETWCLGGQQGKRCVLLSFPSAGIDHYN